MKKVAVVLSGCGFQDGVEITEAVSTLIALGQHGAHYECFAPDKNFTSKDHFSGGTGDQRNTLHESARISRGKIKPLKDLQEPLFDAIVFPGGYGAALHLCNWAEKGSQCTVLPELESTIKSFHQASKPIGAICIAPALIARVLGDQGITVTIGRDPETAQEIEKTGAHHEICPVTDYVTDRQQKVITTPAYMYDEATPAEVFRGIHGLIKELTEMA